MGSRLDGGSRGGGGMSREGHGSRCPSPFSAPSISTGLITTAHQAQTALQSQGGGGGGGGNTCLRRNFGIVVGMGV